MSTQPDISKSTGNVFADLELPEPETALAKAELARRINAILRERELKQAEAAALLGVDQAKISALARGRLSGFSTERLFRFLTLLGRDVQIVVSAKPSSRPYGQVSVQGRMPAAQ